MSELSVAVHSGDHIQGNPNAPITLVEYGDYECPYCGQAFPIVKWIQRELKDDLRFVFRNFPLTQIHPHAKQAALAAEAAALQSKFWEMHDLIYENQRSLSNESLLKFAESLGLNVDDFAVDMASDELDERVQADFMSGLRSGVNGTPTFFINGRRHDGSYDHAVLKAALEKELAAV